MCRARTPGQIRLSAASSPCRMDCRGRAADEMLTRPICRRSGRLGSSRRHGECTLVLTSRHENARSLWVGCGSVPSYSEGESRPPRRPDFWPTRRTACSWFCERAGSRWPQSRVAIWICEVRIRPRRSDRVLHANPRAAAVSHSAALRYAPPLTRELPPRRTWHVERTQKMCRTSAVDVEICLENMQGLCVEYRHG